MHADAEVAEELRQPRPRHLGGERVEVRRIPERQQKRPVARALQYPRSPAQKARRRIVQLEEFSARNEHLQVVEGGRDGVLPTDDAVADPAVDPVEPRAGIGPEVRADDPRRRQSAQIIREPAPDREVEGAPQLGERLVQKERDLGLVFERSRPVAALEAEEPERSGEAPLRRDVAPPHRAAGSLERARPGGVLGGEAPSGVDERPLEREFTLGEGAVDQHFRAPFADGETVGADHRQLEAAQAAAARRFGAVELLRTEETPHEAHFALAGDEEVILAAADPAPGAARHDLGAGGGQRTPLDQHAGDQLPARVQERRFGALAAHRDRPAVPEKPREAHERVEQLGGQLGVEGDPRARRFAVEREEADDLLLLKRKIVVADHHVNAFVEVQIAQIVQVARALAPAVAEPDAQVDALPLARHMGSGALRRQRQLGAGALATLDEFAERLAPHAAVVVGFRLAPFAEREAPRVHDERDGVAAERFRAQRTLAAHLVAGPDLDVRPRKAAFAEDAVHKAVPVAPSADESAAFEQRLRLLQRLFPRDGDQTVFEITLASH